MTGDVSKNGKILLIWNPDLDEFKPIDERSGEGIFMELIPEESQWIYSYTKGSSLIARRTALRSANGISKTGYVHPVSKIRYGVECQLIEEESPYTDMPDKLKQPQRTWYER